MATEAVKRKVEDIIQTVEKHSSEADTQMIRRAFELADAAHAGQKRKSGEDYIIHPVAVASILADYKMDAETICAALLHDVIEDTVYSHEFIAEHFNPTIADLVEGVTKIGKIEYQSKEESQAENIRKMVLAMSKDIRVVLVKLVDRLHNMRTLEYMTHAKQIEKASETMEIYAPIANRLGIQAIKSELEDLSLKYLDPDGYGKINLFNTLVTIIGFVVCLNTYGVISVNYFKQDKREFGKTVRAVSNITVFMTIILLGTLLLFNSRIEDWTGLPIKFQIIALIVSACSVYNNIILNIWRVKEDLCKYGLFSCSFALLSFVLTLILVVCLKQDWEGRINSFLYISIIYLIISVYAIYRCGYFGNKPSKGTIQ